MWMRKVTKLPYLIPFLPQNKSDKNPQTTLMENVKAQEMFVELQKMTVMGVKCIRGEKNVHI